MEPAPVLEQPTKIASGSNSKKDASHTSFYAGFGKGAADAIEGIFLFFQTPSLRNIAWRVIIPLCKAQIAYLAVGLLSFFLFRTQEASVTEFIWSLLRWSRLLTIVMNVILDMNSKGNASMFFEALRQKNEAYTEDIEGRPQIRMTFYSRWINFKRIVKLVLFKIAGRVIRYAFPKTRYLTLPLIKFVSMRRVLGDPVAASVAIIHAIPIDFLESSNVDDFLVSFGESVVDANDMGFEMTKKFFRKVDLDTRAYLAERYLGYIVGCGFVYSLISAIPFLGIPIALISECGAACLIIDITERNLKKETRKPLPGEEFLDRPKIS